VTSIAELYTLQELDLALDAARAGLDDAASRIGEPEELVEAREAVGERQQELRAAEKQFKEREWETDELRGKIDSLEGSLYKGSAHDPKELGDLQREIDSLKRRRSDLEDLALEAMEGLDQTQQALEDAERELQELTETSGTEQGELRDRQRSLEEEITDLEVRRGEQVARIDSSLLGLYDQLLDSRQRRAVVKLEGGSCQGCRISLPMNLLQRARSGSGVVQCSSCERILYVI
jgi:hypothetical protein